MTELVWDGKYDKDGKRVAPVRIALPFQTVETVNESAQVRARQLDLFSAGRSTEWRNRLIWGDKKYVLPSLLPELAGKVNLIYIDPPFATGADFSFTTTIPDSDESFTKEPSMIEQKAYRDTWGRGLDSYLQWFLETAILLKDLLADDGSIYVHCDFRVSRYVGAALTELFGYGAFRNELIWHYSGWRRADNYQFSRKHDTIYWFSKSAESWRYKGISESWVPGESLEDLAKQQVFQDDQGDYVIIDKRRVYLSDLLADYLSNRKQSIKRDEVGQFVWADGRNTVKRYLRDVLVEGKAVDDVWVLRALTTSATERLEVDYPTQKPEALLERIIRASSNKGDLVLALSRISHRWQSRTCDRLAAA